MILIDMDSMNEYWATQGPYYYLVARLISRPDLYTNDIINEYCAAFGKASEEIRRYIDFWEEYDQKVAYNIPAGGMISQNPEGMYEMICRENFGAVMHPLSGHWRTLPYIYTPEIMEQANAILCQAKLKADKEDTKLRIEFLQDGIKQVNITAAFINASGEMKEKALLELIGFTKQMRTKYDYWGQDGITVMKNRGVIGKDVDLNGM